MELDIQKEEHIKGPERPRKAVGLFAKDALGSGIFELSALSTASGTQILTNASGGGGGTSTVFVANAVGNVTLNPSPNFIGIVTIANPAATAGMITLFPGPNHIGSVTIFGTVQSTPGMTTLFPGPNFIGLVTVGNNPSVTVSNLLSLASGTEVRTRPVSNVTLNASAAYIGLASVNIGGTLPALVAGTAQVGSVTVSNSPNITSVLSLASTNGKVAIMNGSDMLDITQTTNTFADAKNGIMAMGRTKLSGASALGRNLLLDDLGAVVIGRSLTTQFAGVLSASGYSTIFVPPSGSRFFIHTAMINSKGLADGYIGSTSNPLIPYVGLATYGGFVHPTENPGLPATAVDQSLTIRQHSLVTISYQLSVHFDQSVN